MMKDCLVPGVMTDLKEIRVERIRKEKSGALGHRFRFFVVV
jgi:hypothetical protein